MLDFGHSVLFHVVAVDYKPLIATSFWQGDVVRGKGLLRRVHHQLSLSFRLQGRPCLPDTQP